MKNRRRAVGAIIIVMLAVVVFTVAQVIDQARPAAVDDYKGHPASPTPSASSPRPGTTAPVAASSSPSSSDADSDAESSPAPGLGSGNSRPSWDPATEAPGGADEEPKVPDGEGTEPYRLPATEEREPALTKVPEASTADRKLSPGFPEQVVPVPDDAQVQSSSVAPQGQRVLVGLDTLSDQEPETVLDFYADHCDGLGWPVTRGSAPDGTPQLHCAFGPDSLTVTARRLPTGMTTITAAGAFEVRKAASSG